jgi:hypothetical protein
MYLNPGTDRQSRLASTSCEKSAIAAKSKRAEFFNFYGLQLGLLNIQRFDLIAPLDPKPTLITVGFGGFQL